MEYVNVGMAMGVLYTAASGVLVCFTYLLYGRWYVF